ncbi:MAG: ATP-binding protein [Ignavibacteria bacterium]|nr:ATP-binding protein [Ignavibacteria bacterium]
MKTMTQTRRRAISQDSSGEPSGGVASERRVSPFEYDFLKSYIYAVHSGRFVNRELGIERCLAHSSLSHRPQKPSVIDVGSGSFALIGDGVLEASVSWKGVLYEVTISKETQYEGQRIHTIYCLGLSSEASSAKQLLEYLLQESVANSFYKNQVLRISYNPMADRTLIVKPVEIAGQALSKIILPDDVREAIEFMIQTIIGYPMLRRSSRYLLEGGPGTGKTETMRAIIEACKGFGTFLLVEGTVDMVDLFDFATLFEPCVICLDDLDLIFGNRHDAANREHLGEFLTMMDGVSKSHVFVLGTVNEKKYLDQAASRPCRWDFILNTKPPKSPVYLQLVKERCTNEHIAGLFTAQVIESMAAKNVTGAFIVNVVKHLEITHVLSPEKLNEQFVLTIIERMHKGFYKNSSSNNKPVGFRAN